MPIHEKRTRDRRGRRGLALVSGVAAAATVALSHGIAQQSPGLRGAATEREIWQQLRPDWLGTAQTQQAQAAPAPQPTATSQPRPASRQGLFGPEAQDAAFPEGLDYQASPSTARERRAARQQGAEAPQAAAPAETEQPDVVTGTVRVPPLADYETIDMRRERPESERERAIEARDRIADASPFAPVGLRLGTFNLFPSLEQGIGWTSNAGLVPGGRPSTFSETTLRLNTSSDWSRHSSYLNAYGTYRRSIAGERLSELEAGLDGQVRLDLADGYFATLGAGYTVRPESPTAPGAVADVVSRPNRHVLTGSAAVGREFGPVRVSATGRVARDMYDRARLSDGTTLSQRDRNSTLATVALRGGYSLSPALTPFAEVEGGRRLYDQRLDAGGYARSANRYAVRGGLELDFAEKLQGEISAGWLTERPDDARLASISGLALDARLDWSPVRGTNVGLTGTTAVEGTTTPGATGAVLYTGALTLSREIRSDLTATALLGADYRRYQGTGEHDVTLRGELGLTWWMNRYVGLTGRVRHEMQKSSLPDRDARATSVFMGMRLQR